MKNRGPLKGIKIIDLTAMVSGPTATMMLGDQGADVIKVEPLDGELMRKVGNSVNGMTDSFLCCNRSKRSITLNLKKRKALNILKKLIASSDIFIQNFRPGTIDRMGLGYEKIKKINKNIKIISFSSNEKKHPIISAWNLCLKKELKFALENGVRKVDTFVSRFKNVYLNYNFDEKSLDPFFNINSENEIKKLENYKIN